MEKKRRAGGGSDGEVCLLLGPGDLLVAVGVGAAGDTDLNRRYRLKQEI